MVAAQKVAIADMLVVNWAAGRAESASGDIHEGRRAVQLLPTAPVSPPFQCSWDTPGRIDSAPTLGIFTVSQSYMKMHVCSNLGL